MKILSIEIGVDVTHVLEMDYRVKNPKVYRSFSFQTPVGVIGEAGVRKSEEFRTALHIASSSYLLPNLSVFMMWRRIREQSV